VSDYLDLLEKTIGERRSEVSLIVLTVQKHRKIKEGSGGKLTEGEEMRGTG
jgi:hypothetical protein